jgi:hypothetical protein
MKKLILDIFLAFVYVLLLAIFMALPIMLLWNWLMPIIFGITAISFWQAFGVGLLSSLLFKSSVKKKKE